MFFNKTQKNLGKFKFLNHNLIYTEKNYNYVKIPQ